MYWSRLVRCYSCPEMGGLIRFPRSENQTEGIKSLSFFPCFSLAFLCTVFHVGSPWFSCSRGKALQQTPREGPCPSSAAALRASSWHKATAPLPLLLFLCSSRAGKIPIGTHVWQGAGATPGLQKPREREVDC